MVIANSSVKLYNAKHLEQFGRTVWDFYSSNKRIYLPWRPPVLKLRHDGSINPYKVLVSEIMLQQTQVDRVIPKFNAWIKKFPTIEKLAEAPLRDVLECWHGLGYNRRGLHLHRLARIVVQECHGKIPRDRELLKELPGIGDYTSGAVMAFVWNEPVVCIETNIRSVFLHHFEEDLLRLSASNPRSSALAGIDDTHILSLLENLMESDDYIKNHAREWYYALMDYGSHLKKIHGNPNRKSKHHSKQSKFEGSNREIRSKILTYILEQRNVHHDDILKDIQSRTWSVRDNIDALLEEGFIQKKNGRYKIV